MPFETWWNHQILSILSNDNSRQNIYCVYIANGGKSDYNYYIHYTLIISAKIYLDYWQFNYTKVFSVHHFDNISTRFSFPGFNKLSTMTNIILEVSHGFWFMIILCTSRKTCYIMLCHVIDFCTVSMDILFKKEKLSQLVSLFLIFICLSNFF